MKITDAYLQETGTWENKNSLPETGTNALNNAILNITKPVAIIRKDKQIAVSTCGTAIIGERTISKSQGEPLLAYIPPLPPENLGDPHFKKAHKIRYPYIMGAMANGITSVDMVIEAARAGMIGFFGAGGLTIERISNAIDKLQQTVRDLPFGFNLIHSPNDPQHEEAVVNLYLKKNVKLVSAAAYMRLTHPLVLFRIKGIHRNSDGKIICLNKVIAKVSRIEVGRRFFSPPPEKIVNELFEKGLISKDEAELSKFIPMAEDLSAEADSGGHTDNRPALALLPTMLALRNEMMETYDYQTPLRVGLGGGIATPESAAAAFAMGAAYILTGSINQSCIEAGTSNTVKQLLAQTEQADVIMAPAADMFEMGVKVQVLKRGTMFALRASKLYEFYRTFDSIESMTEAVKEELEKKFFQTSIENEWETTKSFFEKRDPKQIERASKDSKHKMALLFRSYLGRASMWAVTGEPTRTIDYQIWCGPAMGAFNEWVKGSFLEKPENRKVSTVAMNLLTGACVITRTNWLRQQGISIPGHIGRFAPLQAHEINTLLG